MRKVPREQWEIDPDAKKPKAVKQVKARKYERYEGPVPGLGRMNRMSHPITHTASSRDKCRVCGAQIRLEVRRFSNGRELDHLNPDGSLHPCIEPDLNLEAMK